VRSILRRTEEDVFREDLLAYLRQHITDQRRVDSLAAPAPTHSLPLATLDGGLLPGGGGGGGGGGKNAAGQAHGPDPIWLLLPSDKPAKDGKGGGGGGGGGGQQPKKLFRHGTKALYYEKARSFLALVRSPLPLVAVDVPAGVLSLMALEPAWLLDPADEPAASTAWRAIKERSAAAPGQAAYLARVRDALRERWGPSAQGGHGHPPASSGPSGGGADEAGLVWLFGVRDERGFLLQWPQRG